MWYLLSMLLISLLLFYVSLSFNFCSYDFIECNFYDFLSDSILRSGILLIVFFYEVRDFKCLDSAWGYAFLLIRTSKLKLFYLIYYPSIMIKFVYNFFYLFYRVDRFNWLNRVRERDFSKALTFRYFMHLFNLALNCDTKDGDLFYPCRFIS